MLAIRGNLASFKKFVKTEVFMINYIVATA